MSLFPKVAFLALTVALLASCSVNDSEFIEDDWGPPAGFATISGTVSDSSGTTISETAVFLRYCLWPDQKFLANDTLRLGSNRVETDKRGYYKLNISLPPIGAFPKYEGNTLTLQCEMFAGPHADNIEAKGQGTVIFYRHKVDREPSVINLMAKQPKKTSYRIKSSRR